MPKTGKPERRSIGDLVYVYGDTYKQPYVYRGRPRNRYFVKMICASCGSEMFQSKRNRNANARPSCSTECHTELRRSFNNPLFKGGRKYKRGRKGGHVLLYQPAHPAAKKNFVPEHRVIMEQRLGRYLEPQEIVHHINLVQDDNADDNLILCSGNTEHFLIHGSLNLCVAELIQIGALRFNHELRKYEVCHS